MILKPKQKAKVKPNNSASLIRYGGTMVEQSTPRTCIVTRNVQDKSHMLRFVVDPNNNVVFDLKGNLPGKGMWVETNQQTLKKAIDGNIFSKAIKQSVNVNGDLCDNVEQLIRKKVSETLSLSRRSGDAISGFEKVKELLKSGECAMVFCANADSDGYEKLSGMCRMLELPFYTYIDSSVLSKIFANENVIYTGVKKCGISSVLNMEMKRLNTFLEGQK